MEEDGEAGAHSRARDGGGREEGGVQTRGKTIFSCETKKTYI